MVSDYCQTGTDAFRYGVFAVACGMYDTVLVVGFDKPKDRGVSGPVGHLRPRARPAGDAGGLVLALRRALLRDLRRRPRGPREDRGQESPQRHAGAEVDAEARDHGRGRARRRASSRGRSASTTAPRSRDGAAAAILTRADLAKSFRDDSGAGEGGLDRGRPSTRSAIPNFDFLALEADDLRREGRLRAGGHHAIPSASSTSCSSTTASR